LTKKIIAIFGTRPEAIKFFSVIKKFKEKKKLFDFKICVTAQHREMLDMFLDIFDVIPDYDLDIMRDLQTLSQITTLAIKKIDDVLKKEKPDLVFVQGDTTTAFCGALSAFYNKIKVAHIEAGLRSFDKFQPFPEEINRKLISCISDFNFAPTKISKKNLINEGINKSTIYITGNTSIDAAKFAYKKDYIFKNKILNKINFFKNKIILITVHRRENFGEPIKNVFNSILKLAQENKNLIFIYPVHRNPNVLLVANSMLSDRKNIILIPPLDFFDMQNLLSRCFFIMTDSGGLQEEATVFNKPVLVLREKTERIDGLLNNSLKLVGTETNKIINSFNNLLKNKKIYNSMLNSKNIFGDGRSGEKIYKIISKKL
jgi:UDP-N-acetylglucosamine 2-epimerase (non-hydrolysing)